jgi:hypothetical protein
MSYDDSALDIGCTIVILLVYHFLIFSNIDGIAHNISFYKYDGNSQHFIYWTFFWLIVILGSTRVAVKIKHEVIHK